MSIDQARNAIAKAEAKIADGERERTEADAQLDRALAAAGWRRFTGAFDPGVRLYTHVSNPSAPVPLENVLQAVAVA